MRETYGAFLARPGTWLLEVAQLFAFLLTLSRFYLGAYRFLTSAPPHKGRVGVWEIVWNVVNVSLLFVGFYVAAVLVAKRGMFLLFIAGLHALDLIWFGVGGPILSKTPATADRIIGEIHRQLT